MVPRDTSTGRVLEEMVLPALERSGYQPRKQADIGQRLGGGRHRIDVLAEDAEGYGVLVSLKWQQTSGTAEQKVPFEVMCLADAVAKSEGRFRKAYVVLGGDGWKLKDFYTGGGLDQYLTVGGSVEVLTLESFVARANRKGL